MPENIQQPQTKGDLGTFDPPPSPEHQMKHNHLIVIAIDDYEDPDIPDLHNCLNDAKGLIKVLTEDYFFNKENIRFLRSRGEVRDEEKKSVIEEYEKDFAYVGEATHKNIITQLREIAEKLKKEVSGEGDDTSQSKDNVIIYFSGHGIYDEVLDEGYWIPANAELASHASYIENSTIRTILNAIKSHHTVLISDSCFSGSLFSSKPQRAVGIPRVFKYASRWGLTAGRRNQTVSDGVAGKNSPFAHELLSILRKKQEVWIGDICNDLIQEIEKEESQTPIGEPLTDIIGHDGGQFVFIPRLATEADHWRIAWKENSRKAYYSFSAKYPNGEYEYLALKALNIFAEGSIPFFSEEALELFNFLEDKHQPSIAIKYVHLVLDQAGYLSLSQVSEAINTFLFLQEHYAEKAEKYLQYFALGKITNILTSEIEKEYSKNVKIDPKSAKSTLNDLLFNRFTDERDGKVYKTVEFNGKIWMAENLNYDVGEDCWFYENKLEYGEKFGRLYTWDAATKACPKGWRLPTRKEWEILLKMHGGYFEYVTKAIHGSPQKAYNKLVRNEEIGFNATLGGWRGEKGAFRYGERDAAYWGQEEFNTFRAWLCNFYSHDQSVSRYHGPKNRGQSVRCVRDF